MEKKPLHNLICTWFSTWGKYPHYTFPVAESLLSVIQLCSTKPRTSLL